jgi:hypothetical protein
MALRELDTPTLDNAARDYAAQFLLPTRAHPTNPDAKPIGGRGWVLQSMFDFHYKDEFDYVLQAIRSGDYLGRKALAEFEDEAAKTFKPRSAEVYEQLLAERLAITPDGKAISGKIGRVEMGRIAIGWRFKSKVWKWIGGKKVQVPVERPEPRLVYAHIYVGETPEEAAFRVTKILQDQGEIIFPLSQYPATMALATRISNEAALAACDAIVDRLDEGSGAAINRILDGTQATDPDTAIGAQVTLAKLVYSDPAFGNAADNNPGARATASTITADSSADATGTASWFRCSATNDGATSLDDHIDGSVGTSGCDMNLNTTSIVSGANVSISSHTFDVLES